MAARQLLRSRNYTLLNSTRLQQHKIQCHYNSRQLSAASCINGRLDQRRTFMEQTAHKQTKGFLRSTGNQRLLKPSVRCYSDQVLENEETEEAVHVIKDNEVIQGESVRHEFQAETRQLLDIVARSLYSESEVFIREIISNASDALEKLRYYQISNKDISDPKLSHEIHLTTDEEKGLFIIQDFGVGMEKEEIIDNLGTIARSGSKAFMKSISEDDGPSLSSDNIIGQFGVGFYSIFMVGSQVDVYSKSFKPESKGHYWTSDGHGSYEISEADGVSRGTKIIIHLRDNAKRFASKAVVENIIKKYSNFVGFPIYLNGSKINMVQALWLLDERNIEPTQHEEFYQFITNTSDIPRYHLSYKADAPLNIRSLFYIPTSLPELQGFGRVEAGVSLYSRKVLIQSKAKILPDWLRFVKGLVDSEDVPLNLSRELLQDSALIRKLGSVLASRIVRFFQDEMKKDRVKFEKFFQEFGQYFREGVVTSESQSDKEDIAKLLRFETSTEKAGNGKSLPQYVSDMKPGQKDIFYICAPNRELAETSPYFEAMKSMDVEVLFCYHEHDDVVLNALQKFNGKNLTSLEQHLTSDDKKTTENAEHVDGEPRLSDSEAQSLSTWLKDTLGQSKIKDVKVSNRLASHPAMITVPDMAAARRWLKMIKTQSGTDFQSFKYDILQPVLEINPSNEIVQALNTLKDSEPQLANLVADQIFYNALISAGLLDDPREMVGCLNALLSKTLEKLTKSKEESSSTSNNTTPEE